MEKVYVSHIGKILTGFAFDSAKFSSSEGFPIIRIRDLKNTSTQTFYKGTFESRYIVKKGDLLIGMDGEFNLVEWQGDDGLLNQRVCKLSIDEEKADKTYIKYILPKRLKEIEDKTPFVTVKHLSNRQITNIEILLPCKKEQRQIAQILEEADVARQKRKAANALTDQFLQSTFLSMFGNPLKNELHWPVASLSEVADSIDSGWSPVCEETERKAENEWAVLKLSAVTYGKFDPRQNKRLPSELISDKIENIEVHPGDLLFSRKNTRELIAATAYVFECPRHLLMSDTIFRINYNKERVSGVYLWYLFSEKNFRTRLQSLASGSSGSMPNISKEKLKNVQVPIPPLKLQQQFASIVADTEQLRQRQKSSEAELENLFQSLLQKYFG